MTLYMLIFFTFLKYGLYIPGVYAPGISFGFLQLTDQGYLQRLKRHTQTSEHHYMRLRCYF
jgi:hypothetical protein